MLKPPPGMEVPKYPRQKPRKRGKDLTANMPQLGWSKAWAEGTAGAIARALGLDPADQNLQEFADTDVGRSVASSIIYDGPNTDNRALARAAWKRFLDEQNTIPDLESGNGEATPKE